MSRRRFAALAGLALVTALPTLGPASAEDTRVPASSTATLLAGPSAEERRAGISSAIPSGTEIRSLSFRGYGGTDALVDLSALPATADGVERARIVTQIARTLIGISGIERVWLRSDGRPWGFWRMRGGILDEAWSYDRLVGLDVGSAVPGTEAVTGDYFSAVP